MVVTLGVCCMDVKLYSKPMKAILNRLRRYDDLRIVTMGSHCVLETSIDEWPIVDFLVCFYSAGFPLSKAEEYVRLREPICFNDVLTQHVLLDRSAVYSILVANGIPVPRYSVFRRPDSTQVPPSPEEQHAAAVLAAEDAPLSEPYGDDVPLFAPFAPPAPFSNSSPPNPKGSASSSSSCTPPFSQLHSPRTVVRPLPKTSSCSTSRDPSIEIQRSLMNLRSFTPPVSSIGGFGNNGTDSSSTSSNKKDDDPVRAVNRSASVSMASLSPKRPVISTAAMQQQMQFLQYRRMLLNMTGDDISANAQSAAATADADAAQLESIDSERREKYWGDKDPLEENEDSICVNGMKFRKPFLEKPLFSEDHNIYVYYPKSSGGGSKRLFRKVGDRSSKFVPSVSTVRREGSYIYEEFVTTDGMDIKVYTVGPDYAHAEARKAPTVDGHVMRMEDGKEVRYQVILHPREKEIARRITQIFGQNICGFDLLRADNASYVCDVNGFSFVKGSPKYYSDCAQIMYDMIQSHLHPVPMGISRASRLVRDNDKMLEHNATDGLVDSSGKTELRCVLAVVRHGDRTPKQKVKVKTSHIKLLELFEGKDPHEQVKLKSVAEMQQFSVIIRTIVAELNASASAGTDTTVRNAFNEILESLEETEHFSGINRKVQIKPIKWEKKKVTKSNQEAENREDERNEKEEEEKEEEKEEKEVEVVTQALLIFKYGGQLTDFGFKQADWLGKKFRQTLYPQSARNGLSLHSSYEHDIKFYASDEGRVQMTAAVFARAFLELDEDEIIPILYALVWNDVRSNALLEYSVGEAHCYVEEKKNICDILNCDTDFSLRNSSLDPSQVVAGNITVKQLRDSGISGIGNPRKALDALRASVSHIVEELKKLNPSVDDSSSSESSGESDRNGLRVKRAYTIWKKLQRSFYNPTTDTYDVTKVSDISDCSLFHMLHFPEFSQLARSVYEAVKPLADWMVPNEYGITTATKSAIAEDVIRPLVNKLLSDLTQMRDERHLQILSRYYFTSESHLNTLYNLFAARLRVSIPGPRYQDYISHFVIRLFEDTNLPVSDSSRFFVDIMHSSGAATNLRNPPGNMNNFVRPLIPLRRRLTLQEFVKLMSPPSNQ